MFCPRCGQGDYTPGLYCTNCGYHQSQPIQPVNPMPQQSHHPIQQVPVQTQQPVKQVSAQAPLPVKQVSAQAQPPVPYQQQTDSQASPVSKGHDRKAKLPKPKKKRSVKRFFKKLGIFVAILSFIGLLWFSIGNYITLTIHSNEVVETINLGSLDVCGIYNNAYKQLPTYVQNQIKAPENKNGALIDLILPHIHIETSQINGFFGKSSIEYRVVSPNLEDWFMQLNAEDIVSQEHFLSVLEEHLATAPRAARKVTVNYSPDGLFQWKGNYNTPEFIDAITGGLNTAYSQMYKQIINELKEAMQ